ncbi:radical SAM protein [candidate division KSB1 bacterium]|nr:radical SAM protein [candidate division KSB1 bacterium]
MMDYGPGIQKNRVLDFAPRIKSRWVARQQDYFLAAFDVLSHIPPADRLYARFARWLVGGFVYSVKLEVNTACTLSCEMCYIHKNDTRLPLEKIYKFLDDIRDCRVRLEILGGEPLLRHDLEDIFHYAKYRARVPFISMYTNGIFADEERAAKLKTAGLDAALVTLVSHRREIHDAFTGKQGSWAITVKNIGHLKAAGIKVYTFTAIHKKNYQDYQQIYHFVEKKLGADPLYYQYIPQKQNDALVIDPGEWQKIKHWVLVEKNPGHAAFVRKFYMLTGNACSGGNFVLTIKADGNVQPCPFLNDVPLGNIYHDNIWTIYKNRFQNSRLFEFKCLPAECRDCTYRSVCGGGCRAGNQELFGTYKRRDFRCLGPYNHPVKKEHVVDCVPCFF